MQAGARRGGQRHDLGYGSSALGDHDRLSVTFDLIEHGETLCLEFARRYDRWLGLHGHERISYDHAPLARSDDSAVPSYPDTRLRYSRPVHTGLFAPANDVWRGVGDFLDDVGERSGVLATAAYSGSTGQPGDQ